MKNSAPSILLICDVITLSQPVQGFIKSLNERGWEFKVICNTINPGIDKSNIHTCNKKRDINSRLTKLGIILLHRDFGYFSFEKKAIEKGKVLINSEFPDILISFVNGSSLQPLSIGNALAKFSDIPFMIHTVDPLPSVVGWGEKAAYRWGVIKTIAPFFDRAQYFSANNEAILNYQVELMKFKSKSFWFPTIFEERIELVENIDKMDIFLYAGSFYGKRKPDNLIAGFRLYLKKNPNAQLWIYGNNTICLAEYGLKNHESNQILIRGFTDNIEEIINQANVLIDMDADISNDVFISGKLLHYLSTSKVILSITPLNSPARDWLQEVEGTISIADYNILEIANSFSNSLEIYKSQEPMMIMAKRKSFMSKFSADTVLDMLRNTILSENEN